jgi:serine/threonine protein kinase
MHAELVGSTIDNGRYQIRTLLGAGGMGVVYLAIDSQLQRQVAVKVIKLTSITNKKRFDRECQALAQIQSPHVPSVYSWGTTQTGDAYLVMEFVQGSTLEELLQSNPKPTIAQLLEIFTNVCDGLTIIHENSLVHRDIKPANIMVNNAEDDLKVWIMDFGIVHLTDQEQQLTGTNDLIGSHGYLSPEHLTPSQIDARSDIFSLGCVIYRSLTDELPFVDDSPLVSLVKMKEGTFKPLPSQIPPFLRATIEKCLEPEPKNRFQSTQLLKMALQGDVSDSLSLKIKSFDRRGRIGLISALIIVAIAIPMLLMFWCRFGFVPGKTQTGNDWNYSSLSPETMSEALRKKEWRIVTNQCGRLADQNESWWLKNQQECLSLLPQIGGGAAQAGQKECCMAVLDAVRRLPGRAKIDKETADMLQIRLIKEFFDRGVIDAKQSAQDCILLLRSGRLSEHTRKRLLFNLVQIEFENDLELSRKYLNEAVAIKPLTIHEQAEELFIITKAMATASLRDNCGKWLDAAITDLQSLLAKGQLPPQPVLSFVDVLEVIPLEVRGKVRTETTRKVVAALEQQLQQELSVARKRESNQEVGDLSRDIATLKIAFALLNPEVSKSSLKRTIEEAAHLECRGDPYHALVAHACSRTNIIDGPLLVKLVKAETETWLQNERIQGILRTLTGQQDSATLRYVFENANASALAEIKFQAGLGLLPVLGLQRRIDEGIELVRKIRQSPFITKVEFADEVCAFFERDRERLQEFLRELTERNCRSGSREAVMAALASLAARQSRNSEASRLLDLVQHGENWLRSEVLNNLCDTCFSLSDVATLENIYRQLQSSSIDKCIKVRSGMMIADLCDHLGAREKAREIMTENWCPMAYQNRAPMNSLCRLYKRNNDATSLKSLHEKLESTRDCPPAVVGMVYATEANVLLQQGTVAEAKALLLKISKMAQIWSPDLVAELISANFALQDVDQLKKLIEATYSDLSIRGLRSSAESRLACVLAERSMREEAYKQIRQMKQSVAWDSDDALVMSSGAYLQLRDLEGLTEINKLARDRYSPIAVTVQLNLIRLLRLQSQITPVDREMEQIKKTFASSKNRQTRAIISDFLHERPK